MPTFEQDELDAIIAAERERIAKFADMLAKRFRDIGTVESIRSGNTLGLFATRVRNGEHVAAGEETKGTTNEG